MRLWERIGHGYARIEPYDPRLDGALYLSKYGEVDFSAEWFDCQAPVQRP